MAASTRRAFLKQSLLGAAGMTALELNTQDRTHAQRVGGFDPADLQAMQGVATAFMSKHNVPGLSVAIAKEGRLVYAQGFGLADKDKSEKVTPRHLFRIASVSKPITSTTIFQLIEAGKLQLSDKVFGNSGVLGVDFGSPPYKPYVEEIAIEHLLTHTAGGWQNDGTDPMFSNPQMDHKQLITWTLQNLPLTHAPGTNFAYSNFGYCILGRVIEKITGKRYAKYVRQEVLRRCGIIDMRIAGNTLARRAQNEVVYYGQDGENPYGMQVTRMDSHGGWLASPTDLVRFLVRVDGFPNKPDILRSATERTMLAASSANAGYAKGWSVNTAHNYWHSGSLPGTTTIMVRTASGFCWAALTNTRQPNSSIGLDLDQMVWNMVGKVTFWPDYDLFATPPDRY